MKLSDIKPGEFYTCKQVAEVFNANHQTLVRWCNQKKIPAVKIGEWKILGENVHKLAGSTIASPISTKRKKTEVLTGNKKQC